MRAAAVLVFLTIFSSVQAEEISFVCTCTNDDSGIVFDPIYPPADAWESVATINRETVLDPETGLEIDACVIRLQAHEMEPGDGIPVDEDGVMYILDTDGTTWLTAGDIADEIDPQTCLWKFSDNNS